MSSQEGQEGGGGKAGERGGREEEQASQRGSYRRLVAVRRLVSSRTISPGEISSVAKRPNWVIVVDLLAIEVGLRNGRETERAQSFGATVESSALRKDKVEGENRSGSWLFQG